MKDEVLLTPAHMKWFTFAEGIDMTLLYASEETGRWVVMFKCQPGSAFGMHRHLGAGEYYVLKGKMCYRMGEAIEGTYGYEPLDAIHEYTNFPEYTELYFTNFGPVVFLDDDGNVTTILDHKYLSEMAAQAS